jgi:carboxymethylenebutenolidase
MCYGPDATPPAHGRTGRVSAESDLVLTSADGTRCSAHLARPAEPNGTGMVILPDVRGLYGYYCALATSFAQAGTEAIAIDYFGRTAGLTDGRAEDFDYKPHLQQLPFDRVGDDTRAALDHLRSLGTAERLFTVGFCYGGAMSWRQSAAQEGLAGAIGFYGVPGRASEVIPQMKAPLLMLLAGNDAASPKEAFEAMAADLDAAGVAHRAVTYPGAPHSFFDRTYDQWADACTDSWGQIFDFMEAPPAAS